MKIKIPSNLTKFTKISIEAASCGGDVLKYYFNRKIKVNYKGKIDPVTIADRLTQKTILKIIKKNFPDHTAYGEEDREHLVCKDYCWIIDPLDGTVNFIHKVPVFSVSIALSYKGKIISGVVYAPLLNEMFVAEKGHGAWLNGERIKVSKVKDLVHSLVVTGFPYYIHSKSKHVIRNFSRVLMKVQGLRRLGSAAIDLAYVACGRYDAFWEEGLHPWDVAAGSLLVDESGGAVTDFRNKGDYIWGKSILASNRNIHKKMLGLISNK